MPETPSARHSYLPSWLLYKNRDTFGMVRADVDLAPDVTAYAALGQRNFRSRSVYLNPTVTNSEGDWTGQAGSVGVAQRTRSGLLGLRAKFHTGPVAHTLTLNAATTWDNTDYAFTAGPDLASNLYMTLDVPDPGIVLPALGKLSKLDRSSFGIADTLSMSDERIELTVGVRRQRVANKSFDYETDTQTGSYSANAWSPGFALVIKPTENVSLYANAVEGLQPGTIVPLGQGYVNEGQTFAPYKSRQYEGGIKFDWNRSLMATVSVFQIKQPSVVVVPVSESQWSYNVDGEQRNRGVELNIFGKPLPGFRLNGGLMAIDAKLTKTQDGANDGNRAAGVPKFQGSLGADWDLPPVTGLTLTGRIRHGGKTYLDAANNIPIPSWTVVDVGARYTVDSPWNDKTIVMRLNVSNLFGRNYFMASHFGGLNQSMPRSVVLTATYNF